MWQNYDMMDVMFFSSTHTPHCIIRKEKPYGATLTLRKKKLYRSCETFISCNAYFRKVNMKEHNDGKFNHMKHECNVWWCSISPFVSWRNISWCSPIRKVIKSIWYCFSFFLYHYKKYTQKISIPINRNPESKVASDFTV